MNTDRIEKQVVLHAPLDRVWRAISDSQEFGQWFGVRIDGPFIAGASVNATLTGTTVDANTDPGNEPTTLVEFTLSETADGVLLRIVESGFDAIPETRRADVFEANSGGWTKQAELVRNYLSLGQRV
jgi:uncharacterized protein YndB with AHSA1/START domain